MSESDKCLSAAKNFSRREWLMLIVILLMLEAGALVASHAFMSNQDVINYISFASTIASLLLAVLAIVYGFYQSESQKRVGDGIEVHLLKITNATDKMSAVSQELMENSKGVAVLALSLPALNEVISTTHQSILRLDDNVRNISHEQGKVFSVVSEIRESHFSSFPSSDKDKTPSQELMLTAAENIILNGPNVAVRFTVFGLNVLFKGRENSIFIRSDFVSDLSNLLSTHNTKFQSIASEWISAIYTVLIVLRSIGFLFDEEHKDSSNESDLIILAPGGFALIKKAVEEYAKMGDEERPLYLKIEEELKGVEANR